MGPEHTFSIRAVVRNGVVNVTLGGELDIATVPIMEQQLGPYEQDGVAALVLDLRDLTFFDTAAVHAFVDANDRAHSNGKHFVLVGVADAARRLLELTQNGYLLNDERAAQLLEQFIGKQASDPSGAIEVPTDG